jgi:hypothetical protein
MSNGPEAAIAAVAAILAAAIARGRSPLRTSGIGTF